MTLRRASSAIVLIGLCGGCISVPPDLRADMEPPDGSRPNNFGVLVGEGERPDIRPDRPTIAAASSTTATTTSEGAPR
jgi:hypothetical protein